MNKRYLPGQIILALAVLTSCGPKQVNNQPQAEAKPIYFNRVINYQDESRIKPEIVAECEIAQNILIGIDERTSDNGLPLTVQAAPRELSVEIVYATPGTIGLGNFLSQPATLDISFKVTEGDEVLHEQNRHCKTSLAGFMGLQPSACNKIEKCARSLGEYVSERTSRILYR